MIFISDQEPDFLRKKFCETLNACRKNNGDSELTDYEKEKIVIETIKFKNKEVARLVIGEGSFINRELLACWVFKTIDGYHIGFTGCEKGHRDLVLNLSVGESYRRYLALSKI